MLEFAAPLNVYSFRQFHLIGHDALGLVDKTHDVAPRTFSVT